MTGLLEQQLLPLRLRFDERLRLLLGPWRFRDPPPVWAAGTRPPLTAADTRPGVAVNNTAPEKRQGAKPGPPPGLPITVATHPG